MIRNKNKFIALIDKWVPAGIFSLENEEQIVRARIVLASLWFCFLLMAVSSFALFFVSFLEVRNLWIGLVFTVTSGAMMFASIEYFRRTARLAVAANLFSFIVFFSVGSAVVITGGWDSPVMFLFLSVPVIIFLVAGRRYGLWWSAITVLSYLAIFKLDQSGLQFVQIMFPENRTRVTVGMWCFSCIIIIGCLILYDQIVGNLTTTLRDEREEYRYQAEHDLLSGAYNRDAFQKLFEEELHNVAFTGGRLALIRFDIKNLGSINARVGYDAGDDLIKQAVARCKEVLGENVIVCRFGVSQFSILMSKMKDRGEVISLISRIRNVFARPIQVSGGINICIEASFGGVLAPDFSIDIRSMMRGAQDAMEESEEIKEAFVLR